MFGSSRMELYQDHADSADLEELSQKLSADLRGHVNNVRIEPWISRAWFDSADSLKYVASIAQMEDKLRKTKESSSTLWESDELASRYIVEEGKLNLLLRMLYEHKSNACAADGDAVMRQAGEANGLNGSEIARAIERDAGTIIRCAFGHVEAMQTLDLPLLAEHLSLVLHHLAEDVAAGKAQDYTGQQEVLSVYYLERIGDQLEELGEDRAMEHFADKQLTRRLIRVLALDAPVYDRDTIVAATRALNAIFDSEHFQSHTELHLIEAADTEALMSLGGKFLDELCKDVKFRMSIRSLTDYIKRVGMKK